MQVGAGRLGECVKDDMDELSLHSEWVVFRDKFILGKRSEVEFFQP